MKFLPKKFSRAEKTADSTSPATQIKSFPKDSSGVRHAGGMSQGLARRFWNKNADKAYRDGTSPATQIKSFPKGFFWGAAAAAYQVEGGIENTDWAQAARDGRVPPCGRACDHYNQFESDFDIAKSLGHNAHRLGVEWARIEPEEGKFDEKEIAHYRDVLIALRARGLEPFITLWHFTLPEWFAKRGGFEQADSPEIFARYCAYVVSHLSDLCTRFSTINEPPVYASNGYLRGSWPPFKRFKLTDRVSITNSGRTFESKANKGLRPAFLYWRVMKNLAHSHNAAYDAIKAVAPGTDVNYVQHVIFFDGNWKPWNKVIAYAANYFWTHRFIGLTKGHYDSLGLNYYFYKQFGDKRTWRKTEMDWNFAPDRIYGAIMLLRRYGVPIYVCEAGVADAKDTMRAEYITEQVKATWRAIQEGADVRSHIYWSLLDNYEWALGFEKRFGLVAIDYDTLTREVRPSALVYKKICESNSLEAE